MIALIGMAPTEAAADVEEAWQDQRPRDTESSKVQASAKNKYHICLLFELCKDGLASRRCLRHETPGLHDAREGVIYI